MNLVNLVNLRNSPSCIELIFTNCLSIVEQTTLFMTIVDTKLRLLRLALELNILDLTNAVSDDTKADTTGINKAISQFNWSFTNLGVNEQVNFFNSTLMNIFSNFIPNAKVSCND